MSLVANITIQTDDRLPSDAIGRRRHDGYVEVWRSWQGGTTIPKLVGLLPPREDQRNKPMTRSAYERMICEDLEWLRSMPSSLERDHIIQIVERSVINEYGPPRDLGLDCANCETRVALELVHRDEAGIPYCGDCFDPPNG